MEMLDDIGLEETWRNTFKDCWRRTRKIMALATGSIRQRIRGRSISGAIVRNLCTRERTIDLVQQMQ